MLRKCAVLLFLKPLFLVVLAIPPPSYIVPCSRSDPKLDECATKHGQNAIPYIIKGDKQYKIPNMQPLIVPKIDIQSGANLHMQFTDAKAYGLESIILEKIHVDIKNQSAIAYLSGPQINLQCDYVIDGKILVLPITGKGRANFTFVDGKYTFYFKWDLQKKKDGKNYAVITDHKMTVDTKRDYFYLENLFNGNKLLGDQMNKFLDENWKDVHDEVAPSVTDVVGQIAVAIAKAVYDRVPYDELLLP